MEIVFNEVVPHPFKYLPFNEDSIWGKSFVIQSNEQVLLNATSGKGKTTFTHFLAGIRTDFDGDIRMDNRSIASFKANDWSVYRKEKLSFVFQDLQLFPQLTVAENILLKNSLTDFYTEKEILHYFEVMEIEHKWQEKLGTLSMGQQQRVAIIRAFCQPFQWMILDEPFSHLDKENALLAFQLIAQSCAKQQAGFILTTLNDSAIVQHNKELKL